MHFSRDYRTLAKSKEVYSGDYEEVKKRLSDICDICRYNVPYLGGNSQTSSSTSLNSIALTKLVRCIL